MTGDTKITVPKGMTPTRVLGEGRNTGGFNLYPIANGYNVDIGHGDPVKLSVGVINIATNTQACLGVLQSVQYIDSEGRFQVKPNFVAGTSSLGGVTHTGRYTQPMAAVYDNDRQTYIMQSLVSVSIGNVGHSYKVSAIGSVVQGQSQCVVDICASAGTSAGHMVTILGLWTEPGASFDTSNGAVVEVKLSNPGFIGEL